MSEKLYTESELQARLALLLQQVSEHRCVSEHDVEPMYCSCGARVSGINEDWSTKWREHILSLSPDLDALEKHDATLVAPLKKQCDRNWEDETPKQIVAIACNAIYWRTEAAREDERMKLEAELREREKAQIAVAYHQGYMDGYNNEAEEPPADAQAALAEQIASAEARGRLEALTDLMKVLTSGPYCKHDSRDIVRQRIAALEKLANESS